LNSAARRLSKQRGCLRGSVGGGSEHVYRACNCLMMSWPLLLAATTMGKECRSLSGFHRLERPTGIIKADCMNDRLHE